jgi:hypothetical protein
VSGALLSPGPELDDALARASDEVGLPSYYRDCVRPLLREGPWPRCCGGGCEPCAETLKRVARRVFALRAVAPPPEEEP